MLKDKINLASKKVNTKTIGRHGVPETITIDGREAKAAAIRRDHVEHRKAMAIRQVRTINHVEEQDLRAVKRIARPMLSFKSFKAAQWTLAGVELMHIIRKCQLPGESDRALTVATQFYALAA